MQEREQVGGNIDAIRRITLSKYANEQSSSGKRKLQSGSSLNQMVNIVAEDSKKQKKSTGSDKEN